ncbi:hypothetical protein Peur_015463 [Populus x canadensis]
MIQTTKKYRPFITLSSLHIFHARKPTNLHLIYGRPNPHAITTKSGYLKYHGTKPRLPPSFFTLFLRLQARDLFEAFQVTNLRVGRRPVLFGRQECKKGGLSGPAKAKERSIKVKC